MFFEAWTEDSQIKQAFLRIYWHLSPRSGLVNTNRNAKDQILLRSKDLLAA